MNATASDGGWSQARFAGWRGCCCLALSRSPDEGREHGGGAADGWRSQSLNGSLAAICLQKKDDRLRHYRSENGNYFKEYWLAIASLGPGTVEDGGFGMLLGRSFVTDFDRVFLIMRGFDGRFAEAKDITPPRLGL